MVSQLEGRQAKHIELLKGQTFLFSIPVAVADALCLPRTYAADLPNQMHIHINKAEILPGICF